MLVKHRAQIARLTARVYFAGLLATALIKWRLINTQLQLMMKLVPSVTVNGLAMVTTDGIATPSSWYTVDNVHLIRPEA